VYGHDGLPLVLPLDAAPEDVRSAVTSAGRYRLDPIDENYHPVEGAQSGYLYVYPHHLRNGAASDGMNAAETGPAREAPRAVGGTEGALIEMAKVVTTMAQTVVQAMTGQFPAMMESAATLVRAADGAGLPARPPLGCPGDDDSDDGHEEAPPAPSNAAPELTTVIAQVLPSIVAAFAPRGNGASASASNAAPAPGGASPIATATGAPSRTPSPPMQRTAPGAKQDAPAIPPESLAHFIAIQQALTLEERTLVQALVSELSPDHVRAWMAELSALSVPAALERIRGILHGEAPKESAPAARTTAGAAGGGA
jgi:hypothetical protein